jgi:carbon monoxide dehydrogenase subunit G
MIHFEGTEEFPTLSPAELYPKLSDAGYLARCLPDAEVTAATPDEAVWKLKPKLAFTAGVIETTLAVAERTPSQAVAFGIIGKGVGATSTVVTALTFHPAETGGTIVNWAADITALTGLLKMVPRGLIQATAQKVIQDVWAAVRKKVEAERGA